MNKTEDRKGVKMHLTSFGVVRPLLQEIQDLLDIVGSEELAANLSFWLKKGK